MAQMTAQQISDALSQARQTAGNIQAGITNLSNTNSANMGTAGTRNLQLQSGDPAANSLSNGSAASSVGSGVPTAPTAPPTTTPNPSQNFGNAIMGLLQKYQQLGTKPAVLQGLNAQDQQVQRMQTTDPGLIGAAPGVQDATRSAAVSALQPTVAGANTATQTFNEQLRSYGDAITSAQNFLKGYQDTQDKQKSDAKDVISSIISTGGSSGLASLIKSNPDLFKIAGLDLKTYQEGILPHLQQQEKTQSQKDAADIAAQNALAGQRGGGGGGDNGVQNYVVDPATDASVASIIQANPGEWGKAADAIDAQFGKGTATQYNSWLSGVYGQGQPLSSFYSPSSASKSVGNDVQAVLEGRNTLYNIRQTMGRTNAAAAYMQKMRDSITKIDPNFDFVASDAGGKSVSTAYVQRATAAINGVMPNVDKIVDLSNQVSRIGITGVDKLIQAGKLTLNDKKVANFREAQKLISDEIGVALGAGSVSDMKLQLGFDVTDPSVSPEVFASNMGLVKDFLNNRIAGLQSLRYSSGATGPNIGVGNHGAGTSSDTSGSTYQGYTLPH